MSPYERAEKYRELKKVKKVFLAGDDTLNADDDNRMRNRALSLLKLRGKIPEEVYKLYKGTRSNADIVYSTVHTFKGDENDVVILLSNIKPRSVTGRESMYKDAGYDQHLEEINIYYTACTRARKYLVDLSEGDGDDEGYEVRANYATCAKYTNNVQSPPDDYDL